MLCLANKGYEVALEPRKVYVALRDVDAEKHGQLRVIDESGDHYLFPASLLAPITLRGKARKAILGTA